MRLFKKRHAEPPGDSVRGSRESNSALLKRIRLSTSKKLDSFFAGEYRSAFRGTGLSFDSVREYQYGDDVRAVDWNVSARMNHLYIKEYIEERDISILLLIDVSASASFGSLRSKKDVMLETVDLLLQLAQLNGDRISVLLFSDRIEHFIRLNNGRHFAVRVMDEIIKCRPKGNKTDISLAVDFASKVLKKRSLVFCLSDFLDENEEYQNKLKLLSRRHEVVCIQVCDPNEISMPFSGLIEFADLETGGTFLSDVVPGKTPFPDLPAGSSLRISTADKTDRALLEFFQKRNRYANRGNKW